MPHTEACVSKRQVQAVICSWSVHKTGERQPAQASTHTIFECMGVVMMVLCNSLQLKGGRKSAENLDQITFQKIQAI